MVALTRSLLNFHSIGPLNREPIDGEMRYNLTRDQFTRWLDLIVDAKMSIELTFDDGNLSDYMVALPELQKRGLKASFFILAGKIGGSGYMDEDHIRKLNAAGMGIGAHGVDHVRWTAYNDEALCNELQSSKAKIESIIGQPITGAAAPFGCISPKVYKAVRCAGLRSLYST